MNGGRLLRYVERDRKPQILARFDEIPEITVSAKPCDAHAGCIYQPLRFPGRSCRSISVDCAIRVFIRTVQYDLGVGDNRAASILHDASHAAERRLPKRVAAQEETADEHREEAVIERPGSELALTFSVDSLGGGSAWGERYMKDNFCLNRNGGSL